MRWSLVALAILLAGCLQAPSPIASPGTAAARMHAFGATYEVTGSGRSFKLRLDFGAVATIADDELHPQQAYVLEATLGGDYLDHSVYYLGPDLRQVRHDRLAGIGMESSFEGHPARTVDWGVRGALAPYGVGWPLLVEGGELNASYEGQVQSFPAVLPILSVARNALGPRDVTQTAGDQFTYENHAWPQRMELAAALLHYGFGLNATLQTSEDRGLLPTIDAWNPESPRPAVGSLPALFPAATEPAFGIGITYEQALAGLAGLDPKAKQELETGCVQDLRVYPSLGHPFPPAPADVLPDERLWFIANIANAQGHVWTWQWVYDRPRLNLTAVPAVSVPLPTGDSVSTGAFSGGANADTLVTVPCLKSHAAQTASPHALLRSAWRLALGDWVPCALEYQRALTSNVFEHDSGPILLKAILSNTTTGNEPYADRDGGMKWGVWWVAQDAVTGGWRSMHLAAEDVARLDAGTLTSHPRPLPEPDGPGFYPGVHCVDPEAPSPT